jgi:hypothetical protein
LKLASEIHNASREELIVYLKSWKVRCLSDDSDIELRLAAHRNFRMEGPGWGPVPVAENAPKTTS